MSYGSCVSLKAERGEAEAIRARERRKEETSGEEVPPSSRIRGVKRCGMAEKSRKVVGRRGRFSSGVVGSSTGWKISGEYMKGMYSRSL